MLGAAPVLGVAFDRDALRCALLSTERSAFLRGAKPEPRVEWVLTDSWSAPLFQGAVTPPVAEDVRERVRRALGRLERRAVRVRIALADPMAALRVLRLDALPRSPKARAALVGWQLGQLLNVRPSDLTCTYQYLGREGQDHLVLGIAVPADWLDLVHRAFLDEQFPVEHVDLDGCHLFNRLSEAGKADAGGGAILVFRPDYWSLLIWDGLGRLRLRRSAWVSQAMTGTQAEWVAREVEQIVRASAASLANCDVKRLVMTGGGQNCRSVASALNRRLLQPVDEVLVPAGLEWPDAVPEADHDPYSAALTAGFTR